MLCLIGMGLLDHALVWLAQAIGGDLPRGAGFDGHEAAFRARRLVKLIGEPVGLTLLILAALRVALPQGFVRNEYNLLVLLALALAAGRSFLGRGEGLSADFGLTILCCGLAALFLRRMALRRIG